MTGEGGAEFAAGATGAGALRLKASLSELPLQRTVRRTDRLLAMVPAETGNWTDDAPAGTVADAGAFSAVLLVSTVTATPPDGAT